MIPRTLLITTITIFIYYYSYYLMACQLVEPGSIRSGASVEDKSVNEPHTAISSQAEHNGPKTLLAILQGGRLLELLPDSLCKQATGEPSFVNLHNSAQTLQLPFFPSPGPAKTSPRAFLLATECVILGFPSSTPTLTASMAIYPELCASILAGKPLGGARGPPKTVELIGSACPRQENQKLRLLPQELLCQVLAVQLPALTANQCKPSPPAPLSCLQSTASVAFALGKEGPENGAK